MTVSNGPGCTNTLANAVTVLDRPTAYFVDPPVVYSGITSQVTVYVSGLNGPGVSDVGIRPAGSSVGFTPLQFVFNPSRTGQVQAIIPTGTAAGCYDLSVTDAGLAGEGATAGGCSTIISSALGVTGTTTLALATMDPPFGWTQVSTGVDLRTTLPLPPGKQAFVSVPRACLSPKAGGLAAPLQAVAFNSASLLTAVVPAGLGAGIYDVIVVNPDGSVGVLTGGFTVTADAPPIIDLVTPGSVPTSDRRRSESRDPASPPPRRCGSTARTRTARSRPARLD